jgi:hypothetical protein
MAKKKTKQPKSSEPKKEFSLEEIEAGLQIAHKEYFMQVISLLSLDPNQSELGYVKIPMVTEAGGTYLVSILHVAGPKLNVRQLGKKADAQEAGE